MSLERLFPDRPRFWPNGAIKAASTACEYAVNYSCRRYKGISPVEIRAWRSGSWALFIDALMEAPEVTDDG